MQSADLRPLSYHQDVVAYLQHAEPETWAWASSLQAHAQHAEQVRMHLLRDTYRLSPDSHPAAHEACTLAAERVGVDVPVTLYQAGNDGEGMNAALWYLPGEAHIVLKGQVLERLSPDELLALFGHELSHYRLWTMDAGVHLVADRILDHVLASSRAAGSHVETARLHALHTELFADRGAALAAGAIGPAISTLVKVRTSAAVVDPVAYLAQTDEVLRAKAHVAESFTHPETYVRAQALSRWWQGEANLEDWTRDVLRGPLSMQRLDLLAQRSLEGMTRRFVASVSRSAPFRDSERVATQAAAFFPDLRDTDAAPLDTVLAECAAPTIDDTVRAYLHSVLLDLALVDADIRDVALRACAQAAHAMGGLDAFLATCRRDAGLNKRELDRIAKGIAA